MAADVVLVTLDRARAERALENLAGFELEAELLPGVRADTIPDSEIEILEGFNVTVPTLVRSRTITLPGVDPADHPSTWPSEALDALTPELKAQGIRDYKAKKIAIRQAMLQGVVRAGELGGAIVLQDDVRFLINPRAFEAPFVVYSGQTWRGHWCPRAFYASPATARELADIWRWRHSSACQLWKDTVRQFAFLPPIVIAQPETGRPGT